MTHQDREPLPKKAYDYTFVTDGIESAIELAHAAAGDKDVGVWGGANIMRMYLKDLDPEGIDLRRTSTIETPGATDFQFDVVRA